MIKIKKNITHYLEILLTDVIGNLVANEIIDYSIYKSIDNTLVSQGQLIYIDKGIYQKEIKLSELGQYRIIYEPPTGYANSSENIMVIEDYPIDTEEIAFKLNKLLGLAGENQKTFNMIYDIKGRLVSADTKIYLSKSDTEKDINPIVTYRSFAIYDSFNKMIEVKRMEL